MDKIETVYKFQGKEYQDLAEAQKIYDVVAAEGMVSEEDTVAVATDDYEKQFEYLYDRITRGVTFPIYIQVTDKHDTYLYLINKKDDMTQISLYILEERAQAGWYEGDASGVAQEIVKRGSGPAAFTFLRNRSAYEYELFDTGYFTEVR